MPDNKPLAVHTYQPPITPALPPDGEIRLVPYSDKSFALFGDTKPKKDLLLSLGGKFNSYLKVNNVITPGWIFSKKREDAVRKALSL
jgi:hypothetical protein